MKTIRLYGILAKKFGDKFTLDISSPLEAVRALCAVVPGFQAFLQTNKDFVYRILTGRSDLELQSIANPVSDKEVIRIVPVVSGAGGGGLGSIIEGAALIALAVYAPEFIMGSTFASTLAINTAGAGLIGSMIGAVGMSMVLGGIAQALTTAPTTNQSAAANPSYIFNGAQNNVAQGNPVPICYGELIVGSQVIGVGISTQ